MAERHMWLSPGLGFSSRDPSGDHTFKLFEDMPAGWTLAMVLVSYRLQYQFVATALSPLPYWHHTAIGLCLRGNPFQNEPPNIQDAGGDTWLTYEGVTWSVATVAPTADAATLLYHAPAGDHQVRWDTGRRLVGNFGLHNSLWLSVGTATHTDPDAAFQAPEFSLSYQVRALLTERIT